MKPPATVLPRWSVGVEVKQPAPRPLPSKDAPQAVPEAGAIQVEVTVNGADGQPVKTISRKRVRRKKS